MFINIEKTLAISALILSIVNALFLLRQYLRDKPKLRVRAIAPKAYQWWFEFTAKENDTQTGKKVGFLVYVGVSNSGLRATTIEYWQLIVRRANREEVCLSPIPISHPEVSFTLASGDIYNRKFRALGMATEHNDNPCHLLPGNSINGWAYYLLDGIIDNESAPVEKDKIVSVEFLVTDVFGNKARLKIPLNKVTLEKAKSYILGLEEIS